MIKPVSLESKESEPNPLLHNILPSRTLPGWWPKKIHYCNAHDSRTLPGSPKDFFFFLAISKLILELNIIINWTFSMLKLRVSNGWVWSGHNWVGYIKLIYPFITHLTNYSWPKPNPTQLLWVNPNPPNNQNYQNATKTWKWLSTPKILENYQNTHKS